ncbi:MAG: Ca-activated chloride channel family protein [Planctomycetota bacterium]|jgi:Ca-activated chloride channel family protein
MVSLYITLGVFVAALLGEALHGTRVRRVRNLVFGPLGRPSRWVMAVPMLRVLASTGLAWSLATLLTVDPMVHSSEEIADEDWRHLVLVYDVSPSMYLKDAGASGNLTRHERSRELIESLFDRVQIGKFKVSVVATYNGAKPVVTDTKDIEVVRHMLSEVDMQWAFKVGKTKLFDGIEEAAKLGKDWRVNSALLVIVSDGDTVPAAGMPELPPSFGGTLVVGVGDHLAGSFIAGQQSRQDESALRQLANRLGGEFHNGNRRQVPSDMLSAAAEDSRKPLFARLSLREYALLAMLLSAGMLGALPLLLHYFGTRWRPGVQRVRQVA